MANLIRDDGERSKVFLPRPLVSRIILERQEGFSAYFMSLGQTKEGRKGKPGFALMLSVGGTQEQVTERLKTKVTIQEVTARALLVRK